MADGTQDVYIDATVQEISDWETYLPTSVRTSTASTLRVNPLIVDLVHGSEDPYAIDVGVSSNTRIATQSGIDLIQDVEVLDYSSGTKYLDEELIYGLTTNSGVRTVLNNLWQGSNNYFIRDDIQTEWSILSGLDTYPELTTTYLRLVRGTVGTAGEIQTDLLLSNDKYYFNYVDVYSCLAATPSGIYQDIELGQGRVHYYASDTYSSKQNSTYLSCDTFCSVSGLEYLDYDVELGPGKVTYSNVDTYSSLLGVNQGSKYDIRTWSLLIDNFFLDEGEFVLDTRTMFVDLVDYLYGIDTISSDFRIDGVSVPVTFSGISGGFRMFYDPPNNYTTSGTLTVTAHAVNNIGDIYNINYYLLHGYDVQYTNPKMWNAVENVLVRMQANNEADCYNTEADSFYFVTKDLPSWDLGSSIRCVVHQDLGAEIYPQSTAFFYDKTYTITMKGVKDLSGNRLDDFVLTFTIENP